jgi:hypothetical protein
LDIPVALPDQWLRKEIVEERKFLSV